MISQRDASARSRERLDVSDYAVYSSPTSSERKNASERSDGRCKWDPLSTLMKVDGAKAQSLKK